MSIRIPASMMTQHPDSASRYVPIQEEPGEAISALTPAPKGLGIQEVMIDFEGKLTPYHQTAQVALGLMQKGVMPGQDVFVTPRIPSQSKESAFKQLMALLSVIETNVEVRRAGGPLAIREVILPMCASAQELMEVRLRILHVLELAHKEFNLDPNPENLQLIPLVEEVPELLTIESLFEKYRCSCLEVGDHLRRLRFMVGRSDPAMAYGLVPAVLAVKIAIAKAYEWGLSHAVAVAPILGAGSLPFRGHVRLAHVPALLQEYSGIRTLTLQSAIRYDAPREEVPQVAQHLKKEVFWRQPLHYCEEEYAEMRNVIGLFTTQYLTAVSPMLPTIGRLSDLLPKQRDRLARISPVGYARDHARPERLARVMADPQVAAALHRLRSEPVRDLPRAIGFTGALYNMGIPPEMIGTGRGLHAIHKRYGHHSVERLLARYYPSLSADLTVATGFLHLDAASRFVPDSVMALIREDVKMIHDYLDIDPKLSPAQSQHAALVERLTPLAATTLRDGAPKSDQDRERLQQLLIEMGKVRGSLG